MSPVPPTSASAALSDRASAMLRGDRVSAGLGIEVLSEGHGSAVLEMTVREDMVNGFGVLHGGMTFAFADTAFAVACNETDEVTLAAGGEISFLRPVRPGEILRAHAERRVRSGRSGIYDVRVSTADGDVVAEFRGRSRTTSMAPPVRSETQSNTQGGNEA